MSQKAWVQAYTKGSKSLQARLAKIHANNPEFQEFVKKHGFGGNLSVKQSGIQKKSSAGTVKPVTEPNPERSNLDREAMIKAAAEKIKNRRQAHANRVAFGGELGGGFGLHNVGFRTYREARELVDEAAPKYTGKSDLVTYVHKKDKSSHDSWMDSEGITPKSVKKHGENHFKYTWHDVVDHQYSMDGGGRDKPVNESVAANFRAVVPGLGKLQAKNRAIDLDNELDAGIKGRKFTRKERLRRAKHIERFARVAAGQNAFRKEEKELDKPVRFDKPKPTVIMSKGELGKTREVGRLEAKLLAKQGWKVVRHVKEAVANADNKGKKHFSVHSGPADMLAHKEYMTKHHFKEPTKDNLLYKKGLIKQHLKSLRRGTSKQYDYPMNDRGEIAEDIAYKDGQIAMYKGGWIAKRNGKRLGTVMPTDQHAKALLDATHKSLAHKTAAVISRKAKEIARGLGRFSLATESAANRRRVRSWDSAIMPELKPLSVKPKQKPPFDPDPPKSNPGVVVGRNDPNYSRARHLARTGLKKAMERDRINKTVDYISNPKYSVLDKNKINSLLKGK